MLFLHSKKAQDHNTVIFDNIKEKRPKSLNKAVQKMHSWKKKKKELQD